MKVTSYVAKKWVIAAFEIVLAIIILLFGNRILLGIFPSEAADKVTFQLLIALLWFLVIWCIVAAIRNIIMSLRPRPTDSLQSLNEKIDALDRKLIASGLASATVPESVPPSPEDLKKTKNKKIMVAAAIVAAVVLLAAFSTVFLMSKMSGAGGNPAGGSTPEDTINALVSAMNSKDTNGVLSLTVFSFGNATMKSQFKTGLNQIFNSAGGSFHITMNSHQVKFPTDLNATENSNLTGIKNDVQNHISDTITASCMIVYDMTITTTNNQTMHQVGSMPCFQINGGWYLLLDFGNGGPGGNGNGNQQNPEQTFTEFIAALNQKNSSKAVSFTVSKFASGMELNQAEMNISSMWQNSMSFSVTVNSHQVRNWSMLNLTEQNNLSNIKGKIEAKFSVSITDSCFIQYSITILNDSGPAQVNGNMPCFKINNIWYLKMETQGGNPPGPTIQLMQSSTGTNWTLTVTNVNLAGGPPLSTSNVFLTIKYANGTKAVNMTIDSLKAAGWVNGTSFIDSNIVGQIDNSDTILLDSTIFFSNSVVKLRNFDGTQVYCVQTIV